MGSDSPEIHGVLRFEMASLPPANAQKTFERAFHGKWVPEALWRAAKLPERWAAGLWNLSTGERAEKR